MNNFLIRHRIKVADCSVLLSASFTEIYSEFVVNIHNAVIVQHYPVLHIDIQAEQTVISPIISVYHFAKYNAHYLLIHKGNITFRIYQKIFPRHHIFGIFLVIFFKVFRLIIYNIVDHFQIRNVSLDYRIVHRNRHIIVIPFIFIVFPFDGIIQIRADGIGNFAIIFSTGSRFGQRNLPVLISRTFLGRFRSKIRSFFSISPACPGIRRLSRFP